MTQSIEEFKKATQNSDKDSFRKAFLEYCADLITQEESGSISIEQAGYAVTCALLPDRHEEAEDDIKVIFDIASDMEIPRTTSYKQKIGEWNEKVANSIKEEEWKQFTTAVKAAQSKN